MLQEAEAEGKNFNEVKALARNRKNQERCSVEEFAVYFLNFIRNQTEEYSKGSSSTCNTPRKIVGGFDASSDAAAPPPTLPRPPPPASLSTTKENENNKSISRDIFALDKNQSDLLPFSSSSCVSKLKESDAALHSKIATGTSYERELEELGCYRMKATRINETAKDIPNGFSTPIKHDSTPRNTNSFHSNDSRSFGSSPNFSPFCKSNRKSLNSSISLMDFMHSPANTSRQKGRSTPNNSQSHHSIESSSNVSFSENDFPSLQQRANKSNSKIQTNPVRKIIANDNTAQTTPIRIKKRVAPITISSTTNDFCSPAFRNENNLINYQQHEEMVISRDLLRTHKDAIQKDFRMEKLPDQGIHAVLKDKKIVTKLTTQCKIDLTKVTHIPVLTKFINIHSTIIDMNLSTNVLTELSYLLNLLNAEYDQEIAIQPADVDDSPTVDLIEPFLINHPQTIQNVEKETFKNINNCVFYSLGVLKRQQHLLALLDTTTIKVLLENERLSQFNNSIKDFLLISYTHKIKLESSRCSQHDTSFKHVHNMNVFYQEDEDTKNNFPSAREFGAFKRQRDSFYAILRMWETKHLNPSWIFATELGPKVRSLLAIMDHPINMSHLAKLFTSQLMLSCNFDDASPELQLALPSIDPTKLSKLQQRFHAPSYFSTDYLFPGNQAFFRDFLAAAECNCIFMEQLKIILTNELSEMNNSSYETLHLSMNDNEAVASASAKLNENYGEYVVRPEIISTMRVLAKFLALIFTKPFLYDGIRNLAVDNRQIDLRNALCPPFDIKSILIKSISEQRLIVTIPWIVQFMSMLDYVTLRLSYFLDILNILYELYILSSNDFQNFYDTRTQTMRPTSLFILKLCLGWLFEQTNVPENYYRYRQNRLVQNSVKMATNNSNLTRVELFVPKQIAEYFSNKNDVVLRTYRFEDLNSSILNASLEKISNATEIGVDKSKQITNSSVVKTLDPMLENILNVACPFLADFRVSIMPLKYSKTVSRTGKFRHITTRIAEPVTGSPIQKNTQKLEADAQTKLSEGFLHSQSLSVRRTVEFVIERTVSAVIKDFQMEILLPLKVGTANKINDIKPTNKRQVLQDLNELYAAAHRNLMQRWDEVMPTMIKTRITKAFDALLPNETVQAVKITCVNLSAQKCQTKILEWRTANLGSDLFSKDISSEAAKILKSTVSSTKVPAQLVSSTSCYKIDVSKRSMANLFSQLQYELHKASMLWHEVDVETLTLFLREMIDCFTAQILPSSINRTIALLTLQLALLLICNRPDVMTKEIIDQLILFWQCKCFSDYIRPSKESTDDAENDHGEAYNDSNEIIDTMTSLEQKSKSNNYDTNYIFSEIISNCYLYKLTLCVSSVSLKSKFEALERFLTRLINAGFLKMNILNNQCVSLLREEWDMSTLQQLSSLFSNISRNLVDSTHHDKHELLFLDMLADLSGDIDNF